MAIDRINPHIAINAYSNTNAMAPARGAAVADESGEGDAAGSSSFGDFVKTKMRESVSTMQAGEQQSALAVTGEADLTDVVEALTAAELTLNTAVAIRDRMVSAYQEIMRMPI